MLRFVSHSALVLALVLAATGCSTGSTSAAVQSPAETAATSCTRGTGDAQAERACLQQVLSDLAGLDSNEVRGPRQAAATASRTQVR
ncbi:hypothetical protein BH11MYX4_BH11MYX4_48100 [soil metagenome]